MLVNLKLPMMQQNCACRNVCLNPIINMKCCPSIAFDLQVVDNEGSQSQDNFAKVDKDINLSN